MIGTSDILEASILVVDDQEANVSLLEQMLRRMAWMKPRGLSMQRAHLIP
jgi:CheY-like chemotaxis protein